MKQRARQWFVWLSAAGCLVCVALWVLTLFRSVMIHRFGAESTLMVGVEDGEIGIVHTSGPAIVHAMEQHDIPGPGAWRVQRRVATGNVVWLEFLCDRHTARGSGGFAEEM